MLLQASRQESSIVSVYYVYYFDPITVLWYIIALLLPGDTLIPGLKEV